MKRARLGAAVDGTCVISEDLSTFLCRLDWLNETRGKMLEEGNGGRKSRGETTRAVRRV